MSVERKIKIYSIKRRRIDEEPYVGVGRTEGTPSHYWQVEDFKDEPNIGGFPNRIYFELLSWRMYCMLGGEEFEI